jgi:hypothetical protein
MAVDEASVAVATAVTARSALPVRSAITPRSALPEPAGGSIKPRPPDRDSRTPRPCLLCSTLRCMSMTTNVAVSHATHVLAVSHRSGRSQRSAVSDCPGRLLRSAVTRRSGLLQRSAVSQHSLPSRRDEVSPRFARSDRFAVPCHPRSRCFINRADRSKALCSRERTRGGEPQRLAALSRGSSIGRHRRASRIEVSVATARPHITAVSHAADVSPVTLEALALAPRSAARRGYPVLPGHLAEVRPEAVRINPTAAVRCERGETCNRGVVAECCSSGLDRIRPKP